MTSKCHTPSGEQEQSHRTQARAPNAFHLYAGPSSRGRTSHRGSRESRVHSLQGILGLHSVVNMSPILSASSVIPTSTFFILSYLDAAGRKDRNEEFYCLLLAAWKILFISRLCVSVLFPPSGLEKCTKCRLCLQVIGQIIY